MSYNSLLASGLPNINATANAGWCLTLAQFVFGSPTTNNGKNVPHATAAWNNTKFKHLDRELPSVAVPVWFKWVNNIKGDSNYGVNQGHIVSWIPGRGFLSSPGSGKGQHWFSSIVAVERYFGCTFVGWSEDINGKRVAEYVPDPTPAPVAPPVTTGNGGDYYLDVEVNGYVNSSDAINRTNSNSRVPAGAYKIFNEANGAVNITHDASQPGWWINPADDVAPAPQAGFAVGDRVAPNDKQTVDYNGASVYAWDDVYELIELNGDRAVLKARDTIWAAMNVANIHKV